MQPVPYEDDTEPNMHSEAKEQEKPQAPQPKLASLGVDGTSTLTLTPSN